MAVLQRVSLLPDQRFDTPDARSLEAFSLNDWRFFLKGFLSSKSQILQGFEIANYDTIFTVPGFALTVNDIVFFHPEATTQAAGFYVYAGTEPNETVSLAPNSTNFVEIDLTTVSNVPDVRAFWDAAANGGAGQEFTDTIDTVVNLSVTVSANITGFTPGKLALYKVVTNASNIVTSVTDCRSLFFRLGTGGNTPDPNHNFLWPSSPDASHARLETPTTATSATATNAPFQGGDKNLKSFKDWMDAVMSSIKEIKGTPYWYQSTTSGASSITTSYQNAALTVLLGGTWQHLGTPTPAGHLALVSGSTLFRLGFANTLSFLAFANLDLTSQPVLWVLLPSGDVAVTYGFGDDSVTPIVPKSVTALTTTSITVSTGGNYKQTAGKILVHGAEFTYTSYAPGTGLFSNVSPDPTGLVGIGDDVFLLETGGTAFYHYSSSAKVPGLISGTISEGAERVLWLAVFDGVSTIMLHNGDLETGEQIQVGDNTSLNILQYIGSPSEPTTTPSYSTDAVGAKVGSSNYNAVAGENLTLRLSKLTSMMSDKTQDRNLRFLRSGIVNILNSISGANQNITFTGGSATLNIIIPGSANNMTVGLSGTLALAVNQVGYVTINRNSPANIANLSGVSIASISSVPLNENTVIVAARLADTLIYLWDGTRINVGTWPSDQVLSSSVWQHLGITGEDSHEAVTSTHYIADADSYPEMISNLDNALFGLQSDYAKEESQIVGVGGVTLFTATSLTWSADNTLFDIQVFINGRKAIQDSTGGLTQDYRKNSATILEFSFTVPENARITVRDERTGGGGNWGAPINAHLIPVADNLYDLGSPSFRFRNIYIAGKATIVGGVDPAYIQLTPQFSDLSIPPHSLWVDGNDSNTLKIKLTGGGSTLIGDGGGGGGGGGGPAPTNYLVKIMENTSGFTISMGSPVSKAPDGGITAADSDAVTGQKVVGIAVAAINSGSLGAILLFGPSAEGVLASLGFTPGDVIYVSEVGGYTNDPNSFTGDNDSIIQVGVADCAAGPASATVTDLIMMPQIFIRP